MPRDPFITREEHAQKVANEAGPILEEFVDKMDKIVPNLGLSQQFIAFNKVLIVQKIPQEKAIEAVRLMYELNRKMSVLTGDDDWMARMRIK